MYVEQILFTIQRHCLPKLTASAACTVKVVGVLVYKALFFINISLAALVKVKLFDECLGNNWEEGLSYNKGGAAKITTLTD